MIINLVGSGLLDRTVSIYTVSQGYAGTPMAVYTAV